MIIAKDENLTWFQIWEFY